MQNNVKKETTQYGISNATLRNWKKLKTRPNERLTTRANKRKSKKRILPLEYICNRSNISFVQNTLDYIDDNDINIMSAILSLGMSLLQRNGIYKKHHVTSVLSDYSDIEIIDELVFSEIPNDEFDILGLIYQSYLQEGKKNTTGSYYTPQKIAHNMTKGFKFSNGELFFDPCCGSGAFLLSVAANNPSQLYGVDNDRVAVLIAKINMLLKYRDKEFIPQIYCLNFLTDYSVMQKNSVLKKTFDYITTNPPWGAKDYVRIVKDRGKYSLKNSIWALGIVTGDNKGKLFSERHEGMEKIYTGKEIQPYILRPERNYILYDRANLQQVAKEEIYRAPEKLVYKFISNKLVFAYDDSASLFLNSANILIPNIPSMGVKTVMAFLNFSLFQYMYIKLFGEVKILKGNLIELPFPEISNHEDKQISSLVDDVLNGDNSKQEPIDDIIFSIYRLTQKQVQYVRRMVNGETNY